MSATTRDLKISLSRELDEEEVVSATSRDLKISLSRELVEGDAVSAVSWSVCVHSILCYIYRIIEL